METTSLFPLKYRLRKTDEPVEIVAWETTVKGARNENDWVSYIDSTGNEHVMERLTLEWDFVIDSPFESMMKKFEPTKLPEFDPWEARRYELVKEMYFDKNHDVAFLGYDGLVFRADAIINALKKKSPEAEEEYDNIGIGEIVESIDGSERLKKFVFTDRKDIVGFRGDNGRWDVGDRVKVYIKPLKSRKRKKDLCHKPKNGLK